MDVLQVRHVALVNHGTGIADDKIIYAYVPEIIKYYTGEDPILPNVPTYVCWEELDRKYVLENLESLVEKPANESGGYGIMIGPKASAGVREAFRGKILEDPRNYITRDIVPRVRYWRASVSRNTWTSAHTLYGGRRDAGASGCAQKGSLVVSSSQRREQGRRVLRIT
jgi:hypothetical protein